MKFTPISGSFSRHKVSRDIGTELQQLLGCLVRKIYKFIVVLFDFYRSWR